MLDDVLAELVTTPSPENEAALAAARERGRAVVAAIAERPDMLDAAAFGALLGIAPAEVEGLYRRREVLGLDCGAHGVRYPTWQVDGEGRMLAEMPRLSEASLGGP